MLLPQTGADSKVESNVTMTRNNPLVENCSEKRELYKLGSIVTMKYQLELTKKINLNDQNTVRFAEGQDLFPLSTTLPFCG